ncbi:MAG: DUF6106 family protein [Lachnospiraceae bacterium]|nr:DUF6106 family protein [Lachnospiraceae bacterium]
MGDVFTELVVTRKPGTKEKGQKAGLIGLTILAAFAVLIHPLFLLALAALIIVDYILFPRFNEELEYSYVNGSLDIAAIYSKSSRKELASINLGEAECIAPVTSHHLDGYGITYKTVDYSAGDPEEPAYAAIMGGQESRKVLLQLDEKMLNDLRYRAPGKVFTD